MKQLALIREIFFTVLLFTLMLVGYGVYAVLYPFYRGRTAVKILAGFIAVLVIGLGAAAALFFYQANRPQTTRPFFESVFVIEKGATLRSITDTLIKYRIVESPLHFRLLAIFNGASRKLKAGRYKLSSRMSLEEVLDHIVSGSTYHNVVTISEGSVSWEIAAMLSRKMDLDSAAFIQLCAHRPFIQSLGLDAENLEGYLFPDTYELSWHMSPSDIIRIMIEKFHKVYGRLNRKNPVTRKYSRHQVVIMASIVEGEAAVAHERPLIAGVFYNRLRKGIHLGADPTIRYALRKFQGPLTKSDLAARSPYNTRIYPGLPPGPICNPGEGALTAAADPAQTDKLYFVAKYDGSREHYFTASNREHVQMKRVSRRNQEQVFGNRPARAPQ
jgi:UPF0755 protein